MCMLALVINARCSQQNEVSPDSIIKVTLKPGESYQSKINDVVYKIGYKDIQLNFSEGLGEDGTMYFYRRGKVGLSVNSDSVRVLAEATYDNKGGRKSRDWTYLKDSEGTEVVGSIAIGIANFYPVSSDLSVDNGFAIDLLIQPQ